MRRSNIRGGRIFGRRCWRSGLPPEKVGRSTSARINNFCLSRKHTNIQAARIYCGAVVLTGKMKHNERLDPFLARPSAVDCAVCSQGYAGTLYYYCSKCSEASSIVSYVCTIIIAGLLGPLVAYYMVSIEELRTSWVSFDRVKAVLPLQSVKIIVISWQIVTQVRTVDEACSNAASLYCCIAVLHSSRGRGAGSFKELRRPHVPNKLSNQVQPECGE